MKKYGKSGMHLKSGKNPPKANLFSAPQPGNPSTKGTKGSGKSKSVKGQMHGGEKNKGHLAKIHRMKHE